MRDKAIKETREEQLARLCLDLSAWQEAVCPEKGLFVMVLLRALSAYLAPLPDEFRAELLTMLSSATVEDRASFKKYMATGSL